MGDRDRGGDTGGRRGERGDREKHDDRDNDRDRDRDRDREQVEDNTVNVHEVRSAFEHFAKSLQSSHLPEICLEWADAHYRAGRLILEYPEIVQSGAGYDKNSSNKNKKNKEKDKNKDKNRITDKIFGLSTGLMDSHVPSQSKKNNKSEKNSEKYSETPSFQYSERHLQALLPHFKHAARGVRTFNSNTSDSYGKSLTDGLLPLTTGLVVYFSLAQANIHKLSLILREKPDDSTARESSIAQIMRAENGLGLQILEELEGNLLETIQWINEGYSSTGVRSSIDTQILYYCSLKLVEFRVMSGCARGTTVKGVGSGHKQGKKGKGGGEGKQRGTSGSGVQGDGLGQEREGEGDAETALHESVVHSTQALKARPLPESYDMHFLATIRLAQLLLNARRRLSAASAGKALLVLSSALNKLSHSRVDHADCQKISGDLEFVVRMGILSVSGYGRGATVWSKRHSGATNLTLAESIPGYANW